MEKHRLENRPICYSDETFIDPHAQPGRLLTDCTVLSSDDARARDLSTGLKRNPGRGKRLLVLAFIEPDGLIEKLNIIWIRSDGNPQTEDYHCDIDSKCFYNYFAEALPLLPDNAVVVLDNAAIHNKRPAGTLAIPKSLTCNNG